MKKIDIKKNSKKKFNAFIKEIMSKHNHYSKYPTLFDETYAKRNRFGDKQN